MNKELRIKFDKLVTAAEKKVSSDSMKFVLCELQQLFLEQENLKNDIIQLRKDINETKNWHNP